MLEVVDRLGAALLDATLAASAIGGLVALAILQCRQPVRRRDWARAGLVSTLALWPLALLNPVPRLDVRATLLTFLPPDQVPPPPSLEDELSARGEFGRPPSAVAPARPCCPTSNGGWARLVSRGLVVGYLVGASISLSLIALGLWGSVWLTRRSRSASERAQAVYGSLPFPAGPDRPRLLVSDRVGRPVVVGCFRPVILIPEALDDPAVDDRLRLGLLHELAHAENRDHRFGPLATLAQATWFFVPPIWWIRDRMKLDQEFLADRRAVAHFGPSEAYASSLVELAASNRLRQDGGSTLPSSVSAGSPGGASSLWDRVVMILRCPFAIEGESPRWWRWTTAALLAMVTVAASCLTVRGLAGWSTWTNLEPTEPQTTRSFRLPQLMITPRPNDEQPFDLRFRLPDQFSLNLEVMADPADLPDVEILGHRLGRPSGLDLELKLHPNHTVYRLWHRVEIHREGETEVVRVDGLPVPGRSGSPRLATWLTIRPSPGRMMRIRDLDLRW